MVVSALISAVLSGEALVGEVGGSHGQPRVPFEGKFDNVYLHIHPYCAQGFEMF